MVKSTIPTKPMTDLAKHAGRLAFAASAVFVVLLAALHVLKPEVDSSWRFISEYEIGDYGWMMRLAFVVLGLSCAALGIAILSQVRTVGGYLGLALLAVSAVGMALAGIFVSDPITAARDARTVSGRLHEIGAMLDGVPFAALLINGSLARDRAWSFARRTLFWTAWLPLAGALAFAAFMAVLLPAHGGTPGPDVLVGWPNRMMILAHCDWLMPVAWCAIRLRGGTVSADAT